MTTTFTDRLAIMVRATIALIYFVGTAIAGVCIVTGTGKLIYGGYGFLTAPAPSTALPLPPNHREMLLAGDERAIQREAVARLEGHRTDTTALPYAESTRIEAKLFGLTGRLIEDRSKLRSDWREKTTTPLLNGAALIAFGIIIYFGVWLMRWLLTGRNTTVFSGRRRGHQDYKP